VLIVEENVDGIFAKENKIIEVKSFIYSRIMYKGFLIYLCHFALFYPKK
jgi:hypothetical protein